MGASDASLNTCTRIDVTCTEIVDALKNQPYGPSGKDLNHRSIVKVFLFWII